MVGNSISKSVGVGGVNIPTDVTTIQTLLNLIPQLLGGPAPLLKVDGFTGPKTNGAILGFQRKHFGQGGADGRIDPDQQTLQKILDLLKNSVGPNPPDQGKFSGFNSDQVKMVQKAIADARSILDNAISMVALAPFMREPAPNEPRSTVISLRHNFDVDVKRDDASAGFNAVQLLILQKKLAQLKAGMAEDVAYVFEPKPGFPEAWVVGTTDPTVHIKPFFFDDSFKTELSRAATILHERAHTILKAPGHPGIGGGLATLIAEPHEDKRPLYSSRARFFDDAIANPYNYEWLCASIDSRYRPLGSPDQRVASCGCGQGAMALA